MEKFCFGKVVKLHGYMGEFKVQTQFDDDFDIKSLSVIFDESGNEFAVKRIFKTKDGVVLGLENVDFEKSKSFLNKNIFVDRALFAGKILIEDLKGSEVFFGNGEKLGKIVDVQDYGTAEVFFVENVGGKEVMFPNVKGLIESFEYNEKKLVINYERFCEVSTNED